ncbi:MAG: methyltransferase domain-containing protein [Pseudomonadota bacterium]
MLKFDDDTIRVINESYRGADITRRRVENLAALAPRPGERILDLGCGQGMLTEELARAVGESGRVTGIDPSPEMRAEATARCSGYGQIEILEGHAGAVPLDDGTCDAAISLQVFEYLADIPAALRDLHRILRPAGRLVIGDMAFGTLFWASDDPARMDRMCRSWDTHVIDANLPARLPQDLGATGFHLVEMRPLPLVATTLRPDGLPFMSMHLMRNHAVRKGHVSQDEADAWFAEQQVRSDADRFFFSLTHLIAIAVRL